MADAISAFPVSEFERRTLALQSQMATAGIYALLLTTPPDVFYVTGFLTRFWESPARPWFIVVPAQGEPIAVIPAIGIDLMGRTWLSDIRTWDAPDPRDDGVSLLIGAIAEVVPERGSVGLPMGLETHLRMPVADYERMRVALAPRPFIDATAALQRVREIKSDLEIECIRKACAIADAAFSKVPYHARAGVPLSTVFRQFQSALPLEGADWVSYLAGGAGPNGYGDVISPASDRPLAQGDVLMLDTGAVRGGYFCDFDRNYSVGPPDDAVRRTQEALHAATDAALTTIEPGMSAADLHRVLFNTLIDHGVTPGGGRLGHGLGISLTEWPSLTAKDHSILREGMVLTLEPSAEVYPGRIIVHEENIALRSSGVDMLSPRAPRDLVELAP